MKFWVAQRKQLVNCYICIVICINFIVYRFLGYVDKIGVAYEAPTIATGYGAYIANVRIPVIASVKLQ